jgi:ABC-2 type transport system permease protein
MRGVLTVARKDLRLLARDRAGLFWVVGFPLLMATLFGAIFGGGGEGGRGSLAIAVVDEDGTAGSRAFAAQLEKSEALEVKKLARAEAVDQVRKGKLVAYVAVGKGYGDSPWGALAGGQGEPLLEVGIDPSRSAEAGYLQGILMEASFRLLTDRFADPKSLQEPVRKSIAEMEGTSGLPPAQRQVLKGFLGDLDRFLGAVDPGTVKQGPAASGPRIKTVAVERKGSEPRSAYEVTFPQAIIWGLLGCVSTFAISIVTERVNGTYLRLRLSPLSRGEILGGKAVACFAASCGVVLLLLLVGRLLFGVRLENPAGVLLALVCSALCFVGIMMFLSTLGKTQQSVAGAGWAILLVMSMLGGGMIPLIAMPGWMRAVASFSPVKWAVLSMEGAIWRGFGFREMLLPSAILLAVGAAGFALGVVRLRRADG